MSMHLVGPHLTTTRYNSKKKLANTQKLRDARESHDRFMERMGVGKSKLPTDRKGRRVGLYDIPDYKVESAVPLSNKVAAGGAKIVEHRYTGTLIKGIATMHKSNAVPVTSGEQAIEISRMRRG